MARMQRQCEFRFYGSLRDFLSPARRDGRFVHRFEGTPSIKDQIESLGVPHTEVALILIDGAAVGFGRKLQGGDRVAVYPWFAHLQPDGIDRLRSVPVGELRFVADVHLGRLASYLRLLGFDCLYRNDYGDEELLAIAQTQDRIVLSRDTGLLKRAALVHGAFVHATDPRQQLREVCDRFELQGRATPFTRCARCNSRVEPWNGQAAANAVPAGVIANNHGRLSRCPRCGQLYWPGSHQPRLRKRLAEVGVFI